MRGLHTLPAIKHTIYELSGVQLNGLAKFINFYRNSLPVYYIIDENSFYYHNPAIFRYYHFYSDDMEAWAREDINDTLDVSLITVLETKTWNERGY